MYTDVAADGNSQSGLSRVTKICYCHLKNDYLASITNPCIILHILKWIYDNCNDSFVIMRKIWITHICSSKLSLFLSYGVATHLLRIEVLELSVVYNYHHYLLDSFICFLVCMVHFHNWQEFCDSCYCILVVPQSILSWGSE